VVPKQRQTLLFSATFSDEIRTLANGLLNNPKSVEVARRNTAVEIIEQSMHRVPQAHKRDLLAHLIKHHDWQQVLVFTRTKHGANKLAEKLVKDGSVRVLVATDIAARGIDIDQLPQVVNFELPNVAEDYVHRIGRTGRAGATGSALSLVDDEEMSYLRDIEKLIKRSIVRVEIEPGFVPPAKADLMSEERPPRPPQGRGGPRQGAGQRGAQPGGRNASGRAPQGRSETGGAKPAAGRGAAPSTSAQPRKPRPQAALFSSKPGTRGH
jgi:ATP-dependent RNA helicase RhlE